MREGSQVRADDLRCERLWKPFLVGVEHSIGRGMREMLAPPHPVATIRLCDGALEGAGDDRR